MIEQVAALINQRKASYEQSTDAVDGILNAVISEEVLIAEHLESVDLQSGDWMERTIHEATAWLDAKDEVQKDLDSIDAWATRYSYATMSHAAIAEVTEEVHVPLGHIGPNEVEGLRQEYEMLIARPDDWRSSARKKVRSCFRIVLDVLNKACEFVKSCFGWTTVAVLLILMAAGATVMAIWNVIRRFVLGQDVEEQSNRPRSKVIVRRAEPQGATFAPGVHEKIQGNCFKLVAHSDAGDDIMLGTVTFVYRDYAMFPNHFDLSVKDGLASKRITRDSQMTMYHCASDFTIKLKGGLS